MATFVSVSNFAANYTLILVDLYVESFGKIEEVNMVCYYPAPLCRVKITREYLKILIEKSC